MDFDIHQVDRMTSDSEKDEAARESFENALLERFAQSPEGQERLKVDPGMGFWASCLMRYGYDYEGATVSRMTVGDVRSLVSDVFPRKISLQSPDQADDAIPELVAFWKYLKREFQLPQVDAILEFLHEVEPDFSGMMNDPSNFGMAKSFFAMGRDAGFDMTTQEGMNAFLLAYNASLLARQAPQQLPLPMSSFSAPIHRLDPADRKAEKKKRKQIEAAKKRNRKQRK